MVLNSKLLVIIWTIYVTLSCLQVSRAIERGSAATLINRHFKGDIFFTKKGCVSDNFCKSAKAVGQPEEISSDFSLFNASTAFTDGDKVCRCQCPLDKPTYREDLNECVNDLSECPLSHFVSGVAQEKIPFVFLPHLGHIVYPNAHIVLADIFDEADVDSICVVSEIKLMKKDGWSPWANKNTKPSFQLMRNKDHTYLQWFGNVSHGKILEGRIVLIKLICKGSGSATRKLYNPCIAFRIAGTPGYTENLEAFNMSSVKYGLSSNKSEITTVSNSGGKLSLSDMVAIGVCITFLLIVYAVAIIVFAILRQKSKIKDQIRKQFLIPPAIPPEGLSWKNSKILGLEEVFASLPEEELEMHLNRRKQRIILMQNRMNSANLNQITASGSSSCSNGIKQQWPYQQPVRDISKVVSSGPNSGLTLDKDLLLRQNQALLEAHRRSYMMSAGQNYGNFGEINSSNHQFPVSNFPNHNNSDILRYDDVDSSTYGDSTTLSKEFLKKIRTLVTSARIKMSLKNYSPNLTDIPEENVVNTIEKNSQQNFNKKTDSLTSSSSSVLKFEEEKTAHEKSKHTDRLNNYDTARKKSSVLNTNEDIKENEKKYSSCLNSELIAHVTNVHANSESFSNRNNSPSRRHSESDDNEVVNLAETEDDSEDDLESQCFHTSDDDENFFDSLRPSLDDNLEINEQNSSSCNNRNDSIKLNSSDVINAPLSLKEKRKFNTPSNGQKKYKSIVPNYIENPKYMPNDPTDIMLSKLYDKAVLKIPKVIPSESETIYSDSNVETMNNTKNLDKMTRKKIENFRQKSNQNIQHYNKGNNGDGFYINEMFSDITTNLTMKKDNDSNKKVIFPINNENKLLIKVSDEKLTKPERYVQSSVYSSNKNLFKKINQGDQFVDSLERSVEKKTSLDLSKRTPRLSNEAVSTNESDKKHFSLDKPIYTKNMFDDYNLMQNNPVSNIKDSTESYLSSTKSFESIALENRSSAMLLDSQSLKIGSDNTHITNTIHGCCSEQKTFLANDNLQKDNFDISLVQKNEKISVEKKDFNLNQTNNYDLSTTQSIRRNENHVSMGSLSLSNDETGSIQCKINLFERNRNRLSNHFKEIRLNSPQNPKSNNTQQYNQDENNTILIDKNSFKTCSNSKKIELFNNTNDVLLNPKQWPKSELIDNMIKKPPQDSGYLSNDSSEYIDQTNSIFSNKAFSIAHVQSDVETESFYVQDESQSSLSYSENETSNSESVYSDDESHLPHSSSDEFSYDFRESNSDKSDLEEVNLSPFIPSKKTLNAIEY